ncbi:MAG TPA: hypothetical protein VLE02_01815 [Nitrosarchaeum sp.]|nr:hypothetical protein [Nitrosarchaeum sp.]
MKKKLHSCTIIHFPHKYSIIQCGSKNYVIDDMGFEPCMYKNIKSGKCQVEFKSLHISSLNKDIDIIAKIILNGVTYVNIRQRYAKSLAEKSA